jgi:hypothetical protein
MLVDCFAKVHCADQDSVQSQDYLRMGLLFLFD